ncbi:MAG: kelch repeat-containing protein [Chitinophagaceae bacterium]
MRNFSTETNFRPYTSAFFPTLVLLVIIMVAFSGCEKQTDEDEFLGNWSRRSELEGVARTEAVSFTIGDKTYVGGGYDGSNRLQDFWSFDEPTGTWQPIAPFPGTPRNSAVAFSINGKGYVGTGIDDNSTKLKDFWEYDPISNTWTQKADFGGTGRYDAVGFNIGDKGYICTGYDGNYLKDLWEYTPGTTSTDPGSWAQRASLTGSKRREAVVFVHNNLAYLFSGVNNGTYPNDLWVYDPNANGWTEKRKISSASDEEYDDDYGDNIRRSNATVFVLNNKAFLTCGNRGGILNTTFAYDIAGDTWEQKTSFEGAARQGGISFTVGSKGFLVTGNSSSDEYDDLWEFFSDAKQDDNDN